MKRSTVGVSLWGGPSLCHLCLLSALGSLDNACKYQPSQWPEVQPLPSFIGLASASSQFWS